MGTIGTFFFKIIDDEKIGPFKSPGVIAPRQDNDDNKATDTEYQFDFIRHFT